MQSVPFRRRPGRGHCLGKYGLDHGVFLLDVDALAFWAQALAGTGTFV